MRCCPHSINNEGSCDHNHFEAPSRGFSARCLRFAAWVTPGPRKTHFRLLTKLCRAGLVTCWDTMKGFRVANYISFSFPRLRGAMIGA